MSVTVSLQFRLLGNVIIANVFAGISHGPACFLKVRKVKTSVAMQVVWKCGNTICVCWYSVPCSSLLSASTESRNDRDSSLPCRMLGNEAIQNASAGIPYRAAGCVLKVRKDKVTVFLTVQVVSKFNNTKCVC